MKTPDVYKWFRPPTPGKDIKPEETIQSKYYNTTLMKYDPPGCYGSANRREFIAICKPVQRYNCVSMWISLEGVVLKGLYFI